MFIPSPQSLHERVGHEISATENDPEVIRSFGNNIDADPLTSRATHELTDRFIHLFKWTDSEADMLRCNWRVAGENPFSLHPIMVSRGLSIVSVAFSPYYSQLTSLSSIYPEQTTESSRDSSSSVNVRT